MTGSAIALLKTTYMRSHISSNSTKCDRHPKNRLNAITNLKIPNAIAIHKPTKRDRTPQTHQKRSHSPKTKTRSCTIKTKRDRCITLDILKPESTSRIISECKLFISPDYYQYLFHLLPIPKLI